jgi:hypothetical protein
VGDQGRFEDGPNGDGQPMRQGADAPDPTVPR